MRLRFSRTASALAASVVLLCLSGTVALAEYPPGSFPGPAPAGAFPNVLTSESLCAGGGDLSVADGTATVELQVPVDAFTACSQIAIYGTDATIVSGLLPQGYALLNAIAVAWTPEVQAGSPLTLTIKDPSITTASVAFAATSGGLGGVTNVLVRSGVVEVEIRSAIGILVANRGEGEVGGATGSPGSASSPDAGGTQPGFPAPIAVVLVLVVLAACAGWLVLVRPRSRSG
jgi:hypothetical protein